MDKKFFKNSDSDSILNMLSDCALSECGKAAALH